MISFMTIDRLERNWAICEVENVSKEVSQSMKSFNVDCFMVDVDFDMFLNRCLPIYEGNVYSVIHSEGKVLEVIKLEEEEKQRRIEILRSFGL